MESFDTYIQKRMLVQVGGVIAIAAILGIFVFAYNATYHSVSALEQSVEVGWARISWDMGERYGILPGLIDEARPFLESEASILGDVARDHGRWETAMEAGDRGRINSATAILESSLSRLEGILENHPGLRDSRSVGDSLSALEETEERLSMGQRDYNEGVRLYNRAIHSFPANLWASNWGFTRRDYFTAGIGNREPPPIPDEEDSGGSS